MYTHTHTHTHTESAVSKYGRRLVSGWPSTKAEFASKTSASPVKILKSGGGYKSTPYRLKFPGLRREQGEVAVRRIQRMEQNLRSRETGLELPLRIILLVWMSKWPHRPGLLRHSSDSRICLRQQGVCVCV